MTPYQEMRVQFEVTKRLKMIENNKKYMKKLKAWDCLDNVFRNIALLALITGAVSVTGAIFCFGTQKIALGQAALDGTEPDATVLIDQPQPPAKTAANYPPFMWAANVDIFTGITICSGAVLLGSLIAKTTNDSAFDKAKSAIYNDEK